MFSTSSAPTNASLASVTPQKLNSNQQTVPLPYWWGRKWFAPTWCVNKLYNITAAPSKSGGGKGGKGGGGQQSYLVDVAGVVACGPADFIEAIEVNGAIVWSAGGGITRDVSHPEHTGDIVVPNIGTFRLHWGTSTGTGDFLILNSIGEDHPYYRDQIVLECHQLATSSGSSAPNVRVLLERAPSYGSLDYARSPEGANPITGLCEYITNNFYGLGLAGAIDDTNAAALATDIRSMTQVIDGQTRYMGYTSASITDKQTLGAFMSAVLENFDGWARRNGDKLQFGRFTHEGISTGGLTELSLHDFTEDPKFSGLGYDDPSVYTTAVVTGPDRDWNMEDSWQIATNDAALARLGEARVKTFDRRFICTSYQQKYQAQALASFYAVPAGDDAVKVRRVKAAGLLPGDRCILNYDPSGLREVFRITRRRDDATGGVAEFDVQLERCLAPLPFVSPADPAPARPAAPAPQAIVHAKMFQLPADFTSLVVPVFVPLAERPSSNCTGFDIYFSDADVTYDQVDTSKAWALRGALVGSVTAGAASLTLSASGYDLSLLAAQSAAAQTDNTLLLFIDSEIMSVGAVTAIGGGQYTVGVTRGIGGSTAASHTASTESWVIPRADLVWVEHKDLPRAGGTRYFKLPSFTAEAEQDLSAAIRLVVAVADTRPAAPVLSIVAGTGNAVSLSWTKINLASEYSVYRNTVNNFSTATWQGDVSSTRFVDLTVAPATTYYYWVVATEEDNTASAASNYATATTDTIAADVAAAAAAAAAASSAAAAAQASANAANAELANIASDNVLSAGEKARVILDYSVITTEQSDIDAKATIFGITTEKSAYDTAISALTTYLGTLTTPYAWNDNAGDTTIVGTTFRSKFGDVYSTRQTLLNKIASSANLTAPSDPSAPTYNSGTAYLSADGNTLSRIVVNLPAMPAGGYVMNVLYKKHDATTWILGDQRFTGGGTATLDDLTPGVSYDVAVQVFTYDVKPSNVITATSSPFTAPTKSTGAANPTGFSIQPPSSSYPLPPVFWGGTQVPGATILFTPSADRDAAYFEYSNSGSPSSFGGSAIGRVPVGATQFFYYTGAFSPEYLWVRQFDRTGNASAWVYSGVQINGHVSTSAGSMAGQDSSAVNVSGIQTGDSSASSVRQVTARYPFDTVVTLAGGSAEESFNISLSNRGFVTKPDGTTGGINVSSDRAYKARYDWDDGSNSSSNAVVKVSRVDGTNTGAGAQRITGEFFEYV